MANSAALSEEISNVFPVRNGVFIALMLEDGIEEAERHLVR